MDKKLGKMRAKIKKRIKKKSVFLVVMIILMIVAISGIIPIQSQIDVSEDTIKGYQAGILTALIGFTICYIIRDVKALKDDSRLKRLFYKENDERAKYIDQKVGCSSMKIVIVIMALGSVVASYFDFAVFVTMVVMIYVQAIIETILRGYYTRRLSSDDTEVETDIE